MKNGLRFLWKSKAIDKQCWSDISYIFLLRKNSAPYFSSVPGGNQKIKLKQNNALNSSFSLLSQLCCLSPRAIQIRNKTNKDMQMFFSCCSWPYNMLIPSPVTEVSSTWGVTGLPFSFHQIKTKISAICKGRDHLEKIICFRLVKLHSTWRHIASGLVAYSLSFWSPYLLWGHETVQYF